MHTGKVQSEEPDTFIPMFVCLYAFTLAVLNALRKLFTRQRKMENVNWSKVSGPHFSPRGYLKEEICEASTWKGAGSNHSNHYLG